MSFFDTRIGFLKGVGPQKAALLNTELGIFTYADLIEYYPFRYEDRSQVYSIAELRQDMPFIQVTGKVKNVNLAGQGRKQRLVASFSDSTGTIELVWFKGVRWVAKNLKPGVDYLVYGKPNFYGRRVSIPHPEMEVFTGSTEEQGLQPVYSTTEKLKRGYLDSKAISKLQKTLIKEAFPHIRENLPEYIKNQFKLIDKKRAMVHIHFPKDHDSIQKATYRLKFEELFYTQLRLLSLRTTRKKISAGQVLKDTALVTEFYNKHLPFDLTDAQKRVIREIYRDLGSGKQMNRLLQGDVGSGKTVVAFVCMLIAISSGAQTCFMAPTEILAQQHYNGLQEFAEKLNIPLALLTGSTKQSERKGILEALKSGYVKIIIGTHALLEEVVKFDNLGLVVIDEQHRFGVAQRARLWKKNLKVPPHVLVMTATPIPRTLAMTLYGDLDISVIDQLPAGRKPIQTVHKFDKDRLRVFGFMREQLDLGRQIYVVYPLIEESEKLDLKHLEDGYNSITRHFKNVPVSVVHGKMKAEDKDHSMQEFVKGRTKIMIATTVIEVGVNVPNASVMVIENAERFGLSQLHQLRGRVGRGADQSYCILMTGFKLTKDSRVRIDTMVKTNNGFEIADVDLRLRGPGDLTGTRQSGVVDLKLANLSTDAKLLTAARVSVTDMLDKDPDLRMEEHLPVRYQVQRINQKEGNWGKIS